MSVERVKALDYLHGLIAFSILLIHFRMWILVDNSTQPASVFGSLIIYGVVVFFILSGATMFLVYRSSLTLSADSISSFSIKRIFRIFPLLWLLSSLKPFFTAKSYTIMIYGFFMSSKWHFPPLLDKILTYLGEKSYSIYLLHPLSFDILTSLRKVVYFPNWLFYFSAVILSLILSHFVFKLLEMPMIKVGKKLSKYAEEKMSGNTLASN